MSEMRRPAWCPCWGCFEQTLQQESISVSISLLLNTCFRHFLGFPEPVQQAFEETSANPKTDTWIRTTDKARDDELI